MVRQRAYADALYVTEEREEKIMNTYDPPQIHHGLSFVAILFGMVGGLFFWWVPMGVVLSLAGLLFGFIDWNIVRRRSLDHSVAIIAMFISVTTFGLDLIVALLGLQTVTFGGP
jgi:hypothetical protein